MRTSHRKWPLSGENSHGRNFSHEDGREGNGKDFHIKRKKKQHQTETDRISKNEVLHFWPLNKLQQKKVILTRTRRYSNYLHGDSREDIYCTVAFFFFSFWKESSVSGVKFSHSLGQAGLWCFCYWFEWLWKTKPYFFRFIAATL